MLQLVKSLPFYIPEAWKRYPFRAEPPRMGHYRECPPPPGGLDQRMARSCSNSVAWWIRRGICECCRRRFSLSNMPPILQTESWWTLYQVSISFAPRFRILFVLIVVWRRLFHNIFSHWRSVLIGFRMQCNPIKVTLRQSKVLAILWLKTFASRGFLVNWLSPCLFELSEAKL